MRLTGKTILLLLLLLFPLAALSWDMVDVLFTPPGGGTVLFSHEGHLADLKVQDDCALCHPKLVTGKKGVTMAQMYKGASCGGCHGKTAFTLDACDRCHAVPDVTFAVKPVGDVLFPHDPHTSNRSCWDCHPRLFKAGRNKPVTMAEMERGKSCGACHKGAAAPPAPLSAGKAFPLVRCDLCHKAEDIRIEVVGAGPVVFSHAVHTGKLAYSCADCHPAVFPLDYKRKVVTMYQMLDAKSCGACHDDKTAFTVRENCLRCHDQ